MAKAKMPTERKPLITLRGVTKAFPHTVANDHIDLDIYSGEIHALLGENGAGKSTLVKILFGFYHADAGEIHLDGKPVTIKSPRDALALHIGMVFQDLNLIPAFSIAENIALFLPHLQAVLNPGEINAKITEVSRLYGLDVDPGAIVSQLSIGVQQKVELLKLLLSDAQVLILDEPTRVLAPHEVKALFDILDNLRKKGYAVILITHKLKEVLECADRITVLRGGRVSGSLLRAAATEKKLVEMMFDKHLSGLKVGAVAKAPEFAQPVLELRNVETRAEGAGVSLKAIDLKIYPGQIIGVAGVSGNGQKELCDVVLGMERSIRGAKLLYGKDATNLSVQNVRRSGVSFVPENPLAMASVPFMTTLENSVLTNTWRYARHNGFSIDWAAARSDMEKTAKRLGFSVSPYAFARSLSGGNLQRMVILRELTHDPRLIIASYLTRGLDVQTTIAVRQALLQARNDGAGVLLISEDLDELFTLSDRLIVLYAGRIVGDFAPSETDVYQVGLLMTGSKIDHGN
ncbi:MAG: ABC transporter ATP-binding protein [Anaerolineales bacterium]